jgi:hypothetical protein
LLDRKVQISMAAVGKAWENGYASRCTSFERIGMSWVTG